MMDTGHYSKVDFVKPSDTVLDAIDKNDYIAFEKGAHIQKLENRMRLRRFSIEVLKLGSNDSL